MIMRAEKAAATPANASLFPPYCGESVKVAAAQVGEGLFLQENAAHLMTSDGYLIVWFTCFWCSIWWPSISADSGSPDSPDLILHSSNKKDNEPAFSSV